MEKERKINKKVIYILLIVLGIILLVSGIVLGIYLVDNNKRSKVRETAKNIIEK